MTLVGHDRRIHIHIMDPSPPLFSLGLRKVSWAVVQQKTDGSLPPLDQIRFLVCWCLSLASTFIYVGVPGIGSTPVKKWGALTPLISCNRLSSYIRPGIISTVKFIYDNRVAILLSGPDFCHMVLRLFSKF